MTAGTDRYAVAAVGAILAVDVWLLRTRRETFTEWHRRTVTCHRSAYMAAGIEVYLIAHLWGHPRCLGFIDPLHIASRLITHHQEIPT